MRKMCKVYFATSFVASLIIWKKLCGYKNFENTEKNDIFRKYDERKPRKNSIRHTSFSQSNP